MSLNQNQVLFYVFKLISMNKVSVGIFATGNFPILNLYFKFKNYGLTKIQPSFKQITSCLTLFHDTSVHTFEILLWRPH